jgi:hypothetical protein
MTRGVDADSLGLFRNVTPLAARVSLLSTEPIKSLALMTPCVPLFREMIQIYHFYGTLIDTL